MSIEHKDFPQTAASLPESGHIEDVESNLPSPDTLKDDPAEKDKQDSPPRNAAGNPEPGNPEPGDTELDEFDSLIGSYLDNIVQHEVDALTTVSVVEVHKDHVLVDLGDKAEGVIDIAEFFDSRGYVHVTAGDQIDVQILRRDEESGLIQVSYKTARMRTAWSRLEQAHASNVPVSGRVIRAVKSGLLVDVGVECFMPASQISDQRVQDLKEWEDRNVEAFVVELDHGKRRAILSRRRLVEQTKRQALEEALSKVHEGDILQGAIKSVLNFGAFLELPGGLEGYLAREELSWDRAVSPTSILKPGAHLKVKVLQVDRETGRVRVSRKALRLDPWETAAEKYREGSQAVGEIVSVTRFGAFVRIEEGLTGLIHISDLTWSKGPQRVTDFVKEGDTVRAAVLSVDTEKKRMALGLKQMVEDPWLEAEKQFPRKTKAKGVVTNLAPFGAFVKLADDVEGLIHISDLDWDAKIKHPSEVLQVGQEVEALVLKTDRQTRRISLGIKQLKESPTDRYLREHPVGATVEGKVARMIPTGAFLSLTPHLDGFMHVSQMDRERVEKPENLFKIGETVACKIIKLEKGKVSLSRKKLLQVEESKAIKEFRADPKDKGGMRLGELLGAIRLNPSAAPKQKPKAAAAEPQEEPKAAAAEPQEEPEAADAEPAEPGEEAGTES